MGRIRGENIRRQFRAIGAAIIPPKRLTIKIDGFSEPLVVYYRKFRPLAEETARAMKNPEAPGAGAVLLPLFCNEIISQLVGWNLKHGGQPVPLTLAGMEAADVDFDFCLAVVKAIIVKGFQEMKGKA